MNIKHRYINSMVYPTFEKKVTKKKARIRSALSVFIALKQSLLGIYHNQAVTAESNVTSFYFAFELQ